MGAIPTSGRQASREIVTSEVDGNIVKALCLPRTFTQSLSLRGLSLHSIDLENSRIGEFRHPMGAAVVSGTQQYKLSHACGNAPANDVVDEAGACDC
jgi:hypothetical protein